MIITEDWIFVFNPRTGGRSLTAGFKNIGWNVKHTHDFPPPINNRKVYGVIRNPVDWIWSLYSGCIMGMDAWLDTPIDIFPEWAPAYRLNIYHEFITDYFILEDGLEKIFITLNLDVPKLSVIGKHIHSTTYLPKMKIKYPFDFHNWPIF